MGDFKMGSKTVMSQSGTSNPTWGANAPSGMILNLESTTKTDVFETTSTTFTLVTGLTVSITPSYTSSKIFISAVVNVGTDDANFAYVSLRRGTSTDIFVGDSSGTKPQVSAMFYSGDNEGRISAIPVMHLDSPSTTSATTYGIYLRCATAGNAYVNKSHRDSNLSGYDMRTASSITVMEVAG